MGLRRQERIVRERVRSCATALQNVILSHRPSTLNHQVRDILDSWTCGVYSCCWDPARFSDTFPGTRFADSSFHAEAEYVREDDVVVD